MASVLHGCARTTPRVRAELQASKASTRALAARYGLNPKTVAKWRKRDSVEDAPMGPKAKRGTVLTETEEARIAEFRRSAMLPLDDLLGRLRESVPKLSRSTLYRCLQREGISRLPKPESGSKRRKFSETEIGYFHADAAELRTAEGKAQLFLAVDRVTKLLHVELRDAVEMADGAAFMAGVVETFPYGIHTVLADNGVAFTDQPRYRNGAASFRVHVFDRACRANGIKHRLTKPCHPWTNGQAERMVRTLKEATVRSFQYETRADLKAYVAAHNLGRHLKSLRWLTPFQATCDAWKKDPTRFKGDPHHLIPGPYTPRRLDRRAGAEERGGREKGGGDQALGRSRGGWGTKVHLRVEGKGRPVLFLLSAGQANDAPFLRPLMETGQVGRRLRPKRVAADKAYSHPSLRGYLRGRGVGAVIPTKSNQRARPRFDKAACRERSLAERCVGRLKESRALATRYDRLAKSFAAMVTLDAVLMWR